MPLYTVEGQDFELNRRFAILDTNVLICRFVKSEKHHLDILEVFTESQYQWVISYAVVQEAWHMILRMAGNLAAREYFTWLKNPGSNVLLIPINDRLLGDMEIYNKFGVDCVDGALLKLAEDISLSCNIKSIIATYDTRDFMMLWSHSDPSTFTLYQMEEDYVKLVIDDQE